MSNYALMFASSGRKTFLIFGAVLLFVASGFVADRGYAQSGRLIRATNASATAGVQSQVVVFIQLESQGDEAATSFTLNFNPAVLTNPVVAIGNGVPPNSHLGTNVNRVAQGQIGVLVDSTDAYAVGARNIISVTFTVPASAPLGLYPVTFSDTPTGRSVSSAKGSLLNTTYVTGNVQVGSTAAGIEVSGRVLTPDGRGIRNSRVTITDATGKRQTATTSSFGVYRFETVEAGSGYTISVSSKQYRFTPRVVQIVDTLTDLDFIGQQ